MSGLGEIVLVAGPNGAGKTSFARQFLQEQLQTYTYVNADELAKTLPRDGVIQAEIDIRAGRAMLNRIRQSIALGEDLMIESTLASGNWARHIPAWQRDGYNITLYYLRLQNADAAVARVQRRVAGGGHSIPENVIRRRFERSAKNFELLYKTIVDRWYDFESLEDRAPVLKDSGST